MATETQPPHPAQKKIDELMASIEKCEFGIDADGSLWTDERLEQKLEELWDEGYDLGEKEATAQWEDLDAYMRGARARARKGE